MYKVTMINDGISAVISKPDISAVKLQSGIISRKLNAIDRFSFSVNAYNPAWNKIKPLNTLIKVVNTKTGTTEFLGRVLNPKDTMSNSGEFTKTYECEGELAYLHDTIQRHGEYHNITPRAYLVVILDAHNSQTSDDKKIHLGNVNVTNSTDNVYRYLSYGSSWNSIQDDLVNSLGGYISLRYADGVRYLDYLTASGTTQKMSIDLAKNMSSIERELKPGEIITKLIPLGEYLDSEDETASDASKARLTIASANNGSDYLIDNEWKTEFGIVEGTVIWDDVTTADSLLAKGREWLSKQKTAESITLTALNLSLINDNYDEYVLGNYYTANNQILGISGSYQMTEQSIDIFEPQKSDLTFGERSLTASQYQNTNKSTEQKIVSLSSRMSNTALKLSALASQISDLENQIAYLSGGGTGGVSTFGWNGVDISQFQGAVNFNTLYSKGMKFVMIRAAYRGYSSAGAIVTDSRFAEYVNAAYAAGIRVGLYFFSQATSAAEGQAEADYLLSLISSNGFGSKITFPIAIDIENSTGYPDGRADSNTAAVWGAAAKGFCGAISSAGYTPMIYANREYLTSKIDLTQVSGVDIWLAEWTHNKAAAPKYTGNYAIWQWTSSAVSGTDYGVSSAGLDCDICYKNY